jgi:hypothetical protein
MLVEWSTGRTTALEAKIYRETLVFYRTVNIPISRNAAQSIMTMTRILKASLIHS